MNLLKEYIKQVLLTEISKQSFEKMLDIANKAKHLPFNNLMGDNLRKVIPLQPFESQDILNALKEKGYQVDIEKGLVSKTVETRMGPKQVQEKIGKVIKKELGEEALKNWNKKGGNYSIIISRAPADILRMSDFTNIQSCHSEGGSHFNCVFQEIEDGGLVAFLVSNKEMDKIENLQAYEIFADPQRGIEGIQPTSRTRIRRFNNHHIGMELALPELKVYGNQIPGFQEAVSDWVFKEQDIKLKDLSKNWPDFYLRGASYEDTNRKALYQDFVSKDSEFFKTLLGNATPVQFEEYEKARQENPDYRFRIKNNVLQILLNGRPHRGPDPKTGIAGPAVIYADGTEWWYDKDKLQSFQDPKTGEWMPAKIYFNGTKYWFDKDKKQSFQNHETGEWMPAVVWPNGEKVWYDKEKLVRNPETYSWN